MLNTTVKRVVYFVRLSFWRNWKITLLIMSSEVFENCIQLQRNLQAFFKTNSGGNSIWHAFHWSTYPLLLGSSEERENCFFVFKPSLPPRRFLFELVIMRRLKLECARNPCDGSCLKLQQAADLSSSLPPPPLSLSPALFSGPHPFAWYSLVVFSHVFLSFSVAYVKNGDIVLFFKKKWYWALMTWFSQMTRHSWPCIFLPHANSISIAQSECRWHSLL